jgi:undecaprenyl-diphosphatase
MMSDLVRTVLLAIIQGLTEFLPVSSSAHLILPSELGAWPDQGLAFDVAVHLGTLTAVLVYFRTDLSDLIRGVLNSCNTRTMNADSQLAALLVLASIPVVVAGLLFRDFIDSHLRSSSVIAFTTIIFGIVLWVSERYSRKNLQLSNLGWKQALFIGFAQVLALVPGTSRSGITMSAALFCHQDRVSASRFSFLLSIPAITGAGMLLGIDLIGAEQVDWFMLCLGALLSGLVAWCTIYFFMTWINRTGFLPFVIYRICLGVFLFLII